MPRIRRHNLPPPLFAHLLDRVCRRNVSADQLGLLADWLSAEPEVPDGKWFKQFPGLTVCGEGELIKTFLQPGQIATGKELN
jgi:hypothetical protein